MRRGSSQSRRRSLWTTYCAKSLQPIANVAALTPWQPCYVLLPVGGRCCPQHSLMQARASRALSRNAPHASQLEGLDCQLKALAREHVLQLQLPHVGESMEVPRHCLRDVTPTWKDSREICLDSFRTKGTATSKEDSRHIKGCLVLQQLC